MLSALFEVFLYPLFGELVDSEPVVNLRHGSNLLRRIEFRRRGPSLQFGTRLGVGSVEGVDKHEGLLV